MTARVPRNRIEKIVGAPRHPTDHYARAASAEQTVYILHSLECVDAFEDLRDCPFSLALDNGIEDVFDRWTEDVPLVVSIEDDRLVPAAVAG